MRREGLYESTVTKWRRAYAQGVLTGSPAQEVKPPSEGSADTRRLRRENERLVAELAKTKAVLEVVGQHHGL